MRDILLTDDFDLEFTATGDIKTGESTTQDKRCVLVANKGDYRQYPWIGVGLQAFVLEDRFGGVQQEIQRQFELLGMTVRELKVYPDGKIEEDAGYE